jgi:hypothetical protein
MREIREICDETLARPFIDFLREELCESMTCCMTLHLSCFLHHFTHLEHVINILSISFPYIAVLVGVLVHSTLGWVFLLLIVSHVVGRSIGDVVAHEVLFSLISVSGDTDVSRHAVPIVKVLETMAR